MKWLHINWNRQVLRPGRPNGRHKKIQSGASSSLGGNDPFLKPMKIKLAQKFVLAALTSVLILGGTQSLWAHDGDWDKNHHYYVDKHGYWDEKDHYQKFVEHEGHHGYWDMKGDKKIFIVVGE
jgi:hypothetical protein